MKIAFLLSISSLSFIFISEFAIYIYIIFLLSFSPFLSLSLFPFLKLSLFFALFLSPSLFLSLPLSLSLPSSLFLSHPLSFFLYLLMYILYASYLAPTISPPSPPLPSHHSFYFSISYFSLHESFWKLYLRARRTSLCVGDRFPTTRSGIFQGSLIIDHRRIRRP